MKLIKFILNRVVETSMKLAKKTILGASRPEILTFINSEEGPDGLIKPLSSSFYSNLLRLEDKIQRKDFSENTINEIILLYAVIL